LILVAVLLALVLLAIVGVGVLVFLTRPSTARRRPAETSTPNVASKTQTGSAPVSRGRS
jgi:flagellar basal body-associated protein FliL